MSALLKGLTKELVLDTFLGWSSSLRGWRGRDGGRAAISYAAACPKTFCEELYIEIKLFTCVADMLSDMLR